MSSEIGWRKDLLNETEKKKKRSNSSCSSSSSSSIESDRKKRKKEKKERKEKRREERRLKKQQRAIEKAQKKEFKKALKRKRKEEKHKNSVRDPGPASIKSSDEGPDCSVPIDLMYTKSHAPQTKKEYDKKQSHIRRVVDPETGRSRLIKGDGEILEEIVCKDRHREINKQATKEDGEYFQSKTIGWNPPK